MTSAFDDEPVTGICQGCGKDVHYVRIEIAEKNIWHQFCVCWYMLTSFYEAGDLSCTCTKEGQPCFQQKCTGRCQAFKPKYRWDDKKLDFVEINYSPNELQDGEVSSIGRVVCMGNHVFVCSKCHKRYDWAIEYDGHEGFYCKVCNAQVEIDETSLRLLGIIHPLDGGW